MKKVIVVALILNLLNPVTLLACTTMLITKGASEDGSVIVAHSDDSELFDQRLVYVPAADHKPGSLRPVYYDASALGDRPKYHGYELRRYVGIHRGPTYVDPNQPTLNDYFNLVDEPLNRIPVQELRPSPESLESINQSMW